MLYNARHLLLLDYYKLGKSSMGRDNEVPLYEYICRDCKSVTEVRAKVEEKDKGLQVVCSKCGGENTIHYFGSMTVTAGFPLH